LTEPEKNLSSTESSRPLGAGGWLALFVLAGFLAAGLYFAVHAWNSLAGTSMPATGWLFLILGAVFTLLVGAGLMGLLFYSSRTGKDF
jgi:hypothetical protein